MIARTFRTEGGKRPICVMFERLGPYHRARLAAASEKLELAAVEVFARDSTYAWTVDRSATPYQRLTLFSDAGDGTAGRLVYQAVSAALDRLDPGCVVIPGWSASYAVSALSWCARRAVPAVLMSDSTISDAARHWWSEYLKRRLVRLFGAALVAGERHLAYAEQLGMDRGRIFTGYDVVDNEHFSRGADGARESARELRARFSLPEHYFVASGRFVEKKNLFGLLDAFAGYRKQAVGKGWDLVILGDGNLRGALEARISSLGLSAVVKLPGFVGYDELPIYYGLASAFIHASSVEQWGLVVNEAMAAGLPVLVSDRCGCAPDLVAAGENGFTFDPTDVVGLTDLLLQLSSGDCDLDAMGAASRKIIGRWTPEAFAFALDDAVKAALAAPGRRPGLLDRTILWALSHRS